MFDFFYGNEVEKFQFYRVPKPLFSEKRFCEISIEARFLYGVLLDRTGLSKKNNWHDKDGKVFICFAHKEACELLGIGKEKSVRMFAELEKSGLIRRKNQGQGKPAKIYVMNFEKEVGEPDQDESELENKDNIQPSDDNNEADLLKSENPTSEMFEVELCNESDRKKSENPTSKIPKNRPPYIIGKNDTDMNYIYQSIMQQNRPLVKDRDRWTDKNMQELKQDVQFQIEYDILSERLDQLGIASETLDLIVEIICEAFNPYCSSITVNGLSLPPEVIQAQYRKLTAEHIIFIVDSLKEIQKTKQIKNIRNYLRTCLYNAPHAMDAFMDADIDYHMNN